MSTEQISVGVPEFDRADRMRKALRASGVGVQEMADYLGVSRGTISTWINGRIEPGKQSVRLWAIRTGVPYEWLETGTVGGSPSPTRRTTAGYNGLFVTDSDRSPIGLLQPLRGVAA